MFWLKACSRCSGDLFEDTDIYGRYISCMQCSHYLTESEESLLKRHALKPSMQLIAGTSRKKDTVLQAA